MAAFEGADNDHLLPCTACEGETCQIVTKLMTWNRLLRGSPFEIQEDAEESDQLCLTYVRFATLAPGKLRHWDAPKYSKTLAWLLATHRCIGSVNLPHLLDDNTRQSLLRAVWQNKCIKTLRLPSVKLSAVDDICAALPSLTNIHTLHFSTSDATLDCFVAPLSVLLQTSSSLKCLRLSGSFTNGEMINTLFAALLKKPSLEELDFAVLSDHDDAYPQALKQYLSSTTALKEVAVSMTRSVMKVLLEGVLENRSIQQLSLEGSLANGECMALVSRLMREHPVIRSLSICSTCLHSRGPEPDYKSWVLPLVENDILEEVELPSYILHPTTWSIFFKALATKENMKTVRIHALSRHLQDFCTLLKRSGSEEKVSLRTSVFMGYTDVLECKAFSRAMLDTSGKSDLVLAALLHLPNCQHLKHVTILINNRYMQLSLALAEFLRGTTTLEGLTVYVKGAAEVPAEVSTPWWNVVVKSLSRNTSLKELGFSMHGMSVQDARDLADSIFKNTGIRRLSLVCGDKATYSTFIGRLSEGIQGNYRLTMVDDRFCLHCDPNCWYVVNETVLRNSGLVARAARIKQASHLDRYVTGALERVIQHPALLDEVAESAKLGHEELMLLVRDRLESTQTMDGFMQVVGVVKERVVCHPTGDGRTQLDDLNEDCWRFVRRYLKTDEVQHG